MATKRLKQPVRDVPKHVLPKPAPAPGFWEARVLPFLEKRSLVLVLCLIAVATGRIVATYPILSMTTDEPAHIACGLEYLSRHLYQYETNQPPLSRAMIALGPYLAGARTMGEKDWGREAVAILFHSSNPDRLLYLMRLGILPFFFLASLVVYLWARHHFGNATGVIATGLFTLLPPVLAHAGLATTDMALTACLGAAFFMLVLWAESPTWKRSLLLGVSVGLAVLAKFTALLFLPSAAALALLFYFAVVRPGGTQLLRLARERAPAFGLAVVTGALTIWAGYLFSFGKVPEWSLSLPAPELFDGIRSGMRHNQEGHMSYLLGRASAKGFWYYFPVVLAVKTPIAFLLLSGLGAYLAWKKRARMAYCLPLALSLGILLPAMTGQINIGVRHILPIYLGLSIAAAVAVVQLLEWAQARTWLALAAGLLVFWMAASGAISHPDYLSYFNEFVADPETVLVDSDLDWGQDAKRLAKRMREVGATEINYGPPNHLTDYLMTWPGLPRFIPIRPAFPAEGWTVVSPTIDRTTQYGLYYRYPNLVPWYDRMPPTEKVGALRLYYVPPGSLRRQ
jgi:4-amino-4-deoxy-L-arabinose transferase-like glycosyltransferase